MRKTRAGLAHDFCFPFRNIGLSHGDVSKFVRSGRCLEHKDLSVCWSQSQGLIAIGCTAVCWSQREPKPQPNDSSRPPLQELLIHNDVPVPVQVQVLPSSNPFLSSSTPPFFSLFLSFLFSSLLFSVRLLCAFVLACFPSFYCPTPSSWFFP